MNGVVPDAAPVPTVHLDSYGRVNIGFAGEADTLSKGRAWGRLSVEEARRLMAALADAVCRDDDDRGEAESAAAARSGDETAAEARFRAARAGYDAASGIGDDLLLATKLVDRLDKIEARMATADSDREALAAWQLMTDRSANARARRLSDLGNRIGKLEAATANDAIGVHDDHLANIERRVGKLEGGQSLPTADEALDELSPTAPERGSRNVDDIISERVAEMTPAERSAYETELSAASDEQPREPQGASRRPARRPRKMGS